MLRSGLAMRRRTQHRYLPLRGHEDVVLGDADMQLTETWVIGDPEFSPVPHPASRTATS
jgi:hypothetical protein